MASEPSELGEEAAGDELARSASFRAYGKRRSHGCRLLRAAGGHSHSYSHSER
jgi:hypothetical protein